VAVFDDGEGAAGRDGGVPWLEDFVHLLMEIARGFGILSQDAGEGKKEKKNRSDHFAPTSFSKYAPPSRFSLC
jgi:hypothetical protein